MLHGPKGQAAGAFPTQPQSTPDTHEYAEEEVPQVVDPTLSDPSSECLADANADSGPMSSLAAAAGSEVVAGSEAAPRLWAASNPSGSRNHKREPKTYHAPWKTAGALVPSMVKRKAPVPHKPPLSSEDVVERLRKELENRGMLLVGALGVRVKWGQHELLHQRPEARTDPYHAPWTTSTRYASYSSQRCHKSCRTSKCLQTISDEVPRIS